MNTTSSDDEGASDFRKGFGALKLHPHGTTSKQRNQETKARKERKNQNIHHKEALKILQEITGKSEQELKTALYKATILDKQDETYNNILEYVRNSQEHRFGIEVVNIIRIVRNNDFEFDQRRYHQTQSTAANPGATGRRSSDKFRMMLWHGTKKSCVSSIISSGFARPQNKNQMFGVGIYFADRASKSAQYCDGYSPGKIGYMFLCDVRLGRCYTAQKPHNEYAESPLGFGSVKCVGRNIPDRGQNKKVKGSVLPSGTTVSNDRFPSYSVNLNEYVVYDPERVKAKYLVVVKFHSSKCR